MRRGTAADRLRCPEEGSQRPCTREGHPPSTAIYRRYGGSNWGGGEHCGVSASASSQLYGNLDKICDKYKIVESVWGESYIDEVDDARIEKLVSRLREKLESKPEDPKYLQTIRGRGYKLVSPES